MLNFTYGEKLEVFPERANLIFFFRGEDQVGALGWIFSFFDIISAMHEFWLKDHIVQIDYNGQIYHNHNKSFYVSFLC